MSNPIATEHDRSSLAQYIRSKEHKLLNIYFTAGYPGLTDTVDIIEALEREGVDLAEIGIPFSDPLADGPVIQQSNLVALNNGMTVDLLFDQLDRYKGDMPLLMMGYINPVLQYGFERFLKRCRDVRVSGVILPDLPIELYVTKYRNMFMDSGIDFITLVTPQTSDERIRFIDKNSSGFIYAVSSSSTTGSKTTLDNPEAYLKRLSEMNLSNPILTGFNIKDKASFDLASRYTSGGIIGSAFIKALSPDSHIEESVKTFIKSIRT